MKIVRLTCFLWVETERAEEEGEVSTTTRALTTNHRRSSHCRDLMELHMGFKMRRSHKQGSLEESPTGFVLKNNNNKNSISI